MTEQEGQLKELLDLVEANIDPEHCERVDQRYRRVLAYEDVDWAPLLIRSPFAGQFSLPAPWGKFNRYPYSETFCSPATMLQNQLLGQVVPGWWSETIIHWPFVTITARFRSPACWGRRGPYVKMVIPG